jgi:macrolide phosphotransferase
MTMNNEMLALAEKHGLLLNSENVQFNESGMDFLVAFAETKNGEAWVLRMPRRSDVWERAVNERRVLQLLNGKLPIQVPDWRIFSPELIAYPLLGGHPIATVDPAVGGYAWKYEQQALSELFFQSLAEALAALHGMDQEKAAGAGLRIKSPQEVRGIYAEDIDRIKQSFHVPESLLARWGAWLSEDSYWPEHSALIHGDLHPPHILVDGNQRVTGMIDWTEAEVADPGKDFIIYYALFGAAGTGDLLARYEQAGGTVWPRMHEHIAELWAAYPVQVAKFALLTGKEEHMDMARGMLASWSTD